MGMSTNTVNPTLPKAADQSAAPSGYQRTEVGVIPRDWQVLRFCDHFNIYAGGDVPKDSLSQTRSEKYLYPIYANAIQNKGLYGFTSYKRAKPDSVTITARGYLGHAEYRDEPFFPIVRLLVLEPIGSLDARYTTYAINDRVNFPIESTGVPQLTAPQVGKYAVAAPSTIEEQRAIVEALSDVDGLIGTLEKLIAKKGAIKQAAMQQLLTGKTRLPGFTEAWKARRLGDVLTFQVGCPFSSQYFNSDDRGLRLVRNGDLKGDDSPIYYSGPYEERFLISNGDVLVSMDGEFMPCRWQSGNALLNQRVGRIGGSNELDVDFAQYLLIHPLQEIQRATAGTTVKHLSHGDVAGIEIPLPRCEEQQAIAAALSDMDAEISALEQRRDKTQKIKQGMMQQLLTGRVRLVNGEATA